MSRLDLYIALQERSSDVQEGKTEGELNQIVLWSVELTKLHFLQTFPLIFPSPCMQTPDLPQTLRISMTHFSCKSQQCVGQPEAVQVLTSSVRHLFSSQNTTATLPSCCSTCYGGEALPAFPRPVGWSWNLFPPIKFHYTSTTIKLWNL